MKNILYASDLEEGSRVVFRAAIEQAVLTQGKIHFLHVSDQFHRGQDETLGGFKLKKAHDKHLGALKQELYEYMKQRIHRFVVEEVETVSNFNEEQIEIVVVFGDPAHKIVAVAQQLDAHLIVMGDRRVNALSRFFLGSTAQKVIHNSTCPVLIMPIANQLKQVRRP